MGDGLLRVKVIANPNLRNRLRRQSHQIGNMPAKIDPDDRAGRSLPHLCLNEAAYFRRLGASHPVGAIRSSYFDAARAYLVILRVSRRMPLPR
jgi:hypothetical protein